MGSHVNMRARDPFGTEVQDLARSCSLKLKQTFGTAVPGRVCCQKAPLATCGRASKSHGFRKKLGKICSRSPDRPELPFWVIGLRQLCVQDRFAEQCAGSSGSAADIFLIVKGFGLKG